MSSRIRGRSGWAATGAGRGSDLNRHRKPCLQRRRWLVHLSPLLPLPLTMGRTMGGGTGWGLRGRGAAWVALLEGSGLGWGACS